MKKKLKQISQDLLIRGASMSQFDLLDMNKFENHTSVL